MAIYDSTLTTLSLTPKDRAVSLLARHSERYPIYTFEDVAAAELTSRGVEMAEEFGRVLGASYVPGRMGSSEIKRCYDTAAAIARGAAWEREVVPDARMTYLFLDDAWHQRYERVDRTGDRSLPAEVREVIRFLLPDDPASKTLDIHVSHDTVVGCVAAYLFDELIDIDAGNWPHFLEGMAFWRDNGNVFAVWRGEVREISGVL